MSDTKHLLRQLHDMHLRIKDLQGETEQGQRQLRKFQGRIEHQQKQIADAQEAIKRLKVTIHEKEVEIKANQQKISRHQQQMNEASSKKEYDALRHEIENEKQAIGVLEDETLEAMGALEERTQQLPDLDKTLQQAKEEYHKADADLAGRQAGLAERLAAARAELVAIEGRLPAEVRAPYDRLVQASGEDALAAVQGRTCAGCYTEITPQNYNDLLGGRIIACKSCGRLLYLPE